MRGPDARAAALLLAAPLAAAAEGYAWAPFREHPVALAQAAAVERLAARLRALSADPEPPEQVGTEDVRLFLASLRRASPEAAEALERAVAALAGGAEAGGPVAPAAQEALRAVEEARGVLFPGGHDARPGFGAALAATLLLSEGGVAGAYEEAAEGEAGAYPFGRALLARVAEIWRAIRPTDGSAASDEVDAALARLGALFPAPTPPGRLAADPEEAEAHAQALVGRLETIADADLYPGRDLPGALAVAGEVAGSGCDALAAGDAGLGAERIAVAGLHYEETLGATLGLLAPDAHEAVEGALDRLPSDPAACAALDAALGRARDALAPVAAR